ncbi:MAG: pentapeptide repeat-containing protein, partial [Phaeodactylibacter sp.]|nr:pentapeptide repeat-containing protein [Phaeodactylibacter sp.]
LFSVSFEGCQLDLSSFFKRQLKETVFKNCSLREVDFAEANLAGAAFEHCSLNGAIFEKTNLEGADFRTAQHYSIDPEMNRVRKARFSFDGLAGLLEKYDIKVE